MADKIVLGVVRIGGLGGLEEVVWEAGAGIGII